MIRCQACESNHGLIVDGLHNLCRAKLFLGGTVSKQKDSCTACAGTGYDQAKLDRKYAAIAGMINPSGLTLDTIAKTSICGHCKGKCVA